MKQEIEVRVILEAEVDEMASPEIIASRVKKALDSWCQSSENGLFGDVGFTELIIVEPIEKGE